MLAVGANPGCFHFAAIGKPTRSGGGGRRQVAPPPPPRRSWLIPVLLAGGVILLLIAIFGFAGGEKPVNRSENPLVPEVAGQAAKAGRAASAANPGRLVVRSEPDLPGLPSEYKLNNSYIKLKKSPAEYQQELQQNKLIREGRLNEKNRWPDIGQPANTSTRGDT